jgi:hypothetical protein
MLRYSDMFSANSSVATTDALDASCSEGRQLHASPCTVSTSSMVHATPIQCDQARFRTQSAPTSAAGTAPAARAEQAPAIIAWFDAPTASTPCLCTRGRHPLYHSSMRCGLSSPRECGSSHQRCTRPCTTTCRSSVLGTRHGLFKLASWCVSAACAMVLRLKNCAVCLKLVARTAAVVSESSRSCVLLTAACVACVQRLLRDPLWTPTTWASTPEYRMRDWRRWTCAWSSRVARCRRCGTMLRV